MALPEVHRIKPGQFVNLNEFETDGKDIERDRQHIEARFLEDHEQLIEYQERLYAEGQQKLLVMFQAIDAGGKDGTIRVVFSGVNPQGVDVTSFKKPTEKELSHDFLWRVHNAVPAKGRIGVFNRSHYEDVLVVRVHKMVSEDVWKPRFQMINEFEKYLVDNGTRIVKFFLHISKNEQRKRFQERLDDPRKHWKFERDDLAKRAFWDDYRKAFEDMLEKCSTSCAPWYVIPADQNWYRNFAVCRILVETLRQMDPQYPDADDLSDVHIAE